MCEETFPTKLLKYRNNVYILLDDVVGILYELAAAETTDSRERLLYVAREIKKLKKD